MTYIGNESIFKNLLKEHNIDKELIRSALHIVKDFISSKNLIIYGGLAIDYALRLKGSHIYENDELPDYDCKSDTNVDHAYDLAELLYNKGFKNVKVIKAIHPETMRVRVDLITVCDIGYMPTEYYNKIKTIKYKQMLIFHPDVQRLDLHKAFCFPLKNAPMEDIFHRWNKDLERFNLYEKYYPISDNTIDIKYHKVSVTIPNINFAFHGFAAYAFYRKELEKFKKKIVDIPSLDIEYDSGTNAACTISIPDCDSGIQVCVPDFDSLPVSEEYAPILGYIPKKIIQYSGESQSESQSGGQSSSKNGMLSYYHTQMLSIVTFSSENYTCKLVNIQYLLMYFLFMANFSDGLYLNFYVWTLRMITLVEKWFPNDLGIFAPSIELIAPERIYEIKEVNNMPINYAPEKGVRPTFDYSNYKVSGEYVS